MYYIVRRDSESKYLRDYSLGLKVTHTSSFTHIEPSKENYPTRLFTGTSKQSLLELEIFEGHA